MVCVIELVGHLSQILLERYFLKQNAVMALSKDLDESDEHDKIIPRGFPLILPFFPSDLHPSLPPSSPPFACQETVRFSAMLQTLVRHREERNTRT